MSDHVRSTWRFIWHFVRTGFENYNPDWTVSSFSTVTVNLSMGLLLSCAGCVSVLAVLAVMRAGFSQLWRLSTRTCITSLCNWITWSIGTFGYIIVLLGLTALTGTVAQSKWQPSVSGSLAYVIFKSAPWLAAEPCANFEGVVFKFLDIRHPHY